MSDEELKQEHEEESIQEPEIQEEELESSSEPEGEQEEDSEIIEKAKKYGHISKEEWVKQGRDPAKYKTPQEFNKTGEVIEQVYSLKKKVDQRDREIQALIDYQERTKQREYERAKQELEARLNASKNDLDMEGVAHFTKELTRLEDVENHSRNHQRQQAQLDAQQRFIDRNQNWFNDRNPDLKQRAIQIDNELKDIFPNATFDELAQKIETRMQYEYPERVMGGAKNARPAVSNSSVNKTAVNTTSASKVFKGLSQDLKDTYSAYKRIKASMGQDLTEADFIDKLKKDGEI